MIRVRFTKDCDGRLVDEVRDYDEVSAKHLLDSGAAVRSRAKSTDAPDEAVAPDVVVETVADPQPVTTKGRKSAD